MGLYVRRGPAVPVLAYLVVLLAGVLPMPASAAEPEIGAVTAVSGGASLKQPGRERALTARKGLPVRVGDVVSTESDGSCQVALTDESFMNLGSSTAVRVNQYSFDTVTDRRTAVVQILDGSARIVILRARGGGSRFRVETDTAAIDPDPFSDLIVTARSDTTDIVVLQKGASAMNRKTLYVGEVRIGENQRATVKKDNPPLTPVTVPRDERQRLLRSFSGQ